MTKFVNTGSRKPRRSRLIAATALASAAIFAAAMPSAAQAQQSTAQRSFDFDIPAQPLAAAVNDLALTAGIQVLYEGDDTKDLRGAAVKGRMTVDQALARLLSGTGYTFEYTRPGVISLRRAAAVGNDGERVTGAVQVEGLQGTGSPYFGGAGQAAGVNGINGSRDITATEGTGSFTSGALTIGSKVPQALKDVPQSLSVITSERLQQQNITDFTTAMKQLPGVTLVQGASSLQNVFYSRGFPIQSISVDGGAPMVTGFRGQIVENIGYYPQIDMSQYDHVELLRGATGLFNGYGDPGGTVNLVRKKPLDHSQYTLEGQAGSWSNYRVVADASSPLALDGKLRGRLVMTYQDNHYFYDTAKDNKSLIYGIAELDLTPTTLVSAGISYTKQDSVPWINGLPRYQTGGDLGLPRSTSFVFPWNRWNFETTELFGSIEQQLGGEWKLKLNVTRNQQQSTQKVGYNQNAVNPANNMGPMLGGFYFDYGSDQFSTEATLAGAFTLFGQRQEITVGVNRANADYGGQRAFTSLISSSPSEPYQPYPGGPRYCYDYGTSNPAYQCPPDTIRPALPPIDVFNFDPNDPIYSEPPNPIPVNKILSGGQVIWGAYINLRLTAFDRLHLTTGTRWSRYENKLVNDDYCTYVGGTCAAIGDVLNHTSAFYHNTNVSWPPAVNLSFDISGQMTAYAGYTDIYQDQSKNLTIDLQPIEPITGSNWEGGIKWAPKDGRLNVTLAIYRITQKGFATADGYTDYDTGEFVASNGQRFPNYGKIDAEHTCCYKPRSNQARQSQGIDRRLCT